MSQEEDMPMPMSPGSMSNNGTRNMKDMVMHMSFYWGKDATILFQGWPNHCLPMYILSLFFVFLLSLATEVLSVSPAEAKPGTSPVTGGVTQAGVYAVRIALAYMVMLSVMSFNLGIFVAAVAGHTVGFFLVKYRATAAQEEATTGFTPKV
ncbi:copper transporter 6-like [Actinidia eriantha]|uniref:copper transporter 6-like n=1 Tax=Actinidia eriantha TaxID=165200 RepID=UPI002585A3E4|nr:copper transporter 6-like [Actinidia eriantha]